MTLQQVENVNFGRTKGFATGSSGVGYTLYDATGSVQQLRTTSGVYEVVPGSGLYAAYISLPDEWHGQVVWDTGTAFVTASHAIEQLNVEEHDPRVADNNHMLSQMSGTIGLLYDSQYGRWKIEQNRMRFFKEDNVTLVAEFDLFDDNGVPSMDAVFERRRI